METESMTFVMISKEELRQLLATQQDILCQLQELKSGASKQPIATHLTAKEFMAAVKIRRTKFDELVQANKIKIIKKRRKIYVPIGEVQRFFSDPSVQ